MKTESGNYHINTGGRVTSVGGRQINYPSQTDDSASTVAQLEAKLFAQVAGTEMPVTTFAAKTKTQSAFERFQSENQTVRELELLLFNQIVDHAKQARELMEQQHRSNMPLNGTVRRF